MKQKKEEKEKKEVTNTSSGDTQDYENWAPSDGTNVGCWMGQTVTYSRRIRTSVCNDTRGELLLSSTTCTCTDEDYEWYERGRGQEEVGWEGRSEGGRRGN